MILQRILDTKREEVAASERETPAERLRARALYNEPRRGFVAALERPGTPAVIAEIKRASPSKGLIRDDFDPAAHARDYESAGARCVSVLTDREYFRGSLDDLACARAACALPLLRKDFTIDAYQITEARAYGADAVLLIVAALDADRLAALQAAAVEEGVDALVEVHDAAELQTALEAGATLVGINNRNLSTFETSLDVTRRLVREIPEGVVVVSESGLDSREQLAELHALGVHAFLIGEHLMRAPSPGRALSALIAP